MKHAFYFFSKNNKKNMYEQKYITFLEKKNKT